MDNHKTYINMPIKKMGQLGWNLPVVPLGVKLEIQAVICAITWAATRLPPNSWTVWNLPVLSEPFTINIIKPKWVAEWVCKMEGTGTFR